MANIANKKINTALKNNPNNTRNGKSKMPIPQSMATANTNIKPTKNSFILGTPANLYRQLIDARPFTETTVIVAHIRKP